MKNFISLLAALLVSSFSMGTNAQEAKIGRVTISGAYTKATVAGQMAGSGFMKIAVSGVSDQLIGATSPAAGDVQMHSMSMEGTTMKMRQMNSIEIPANSSVELTPGGLHLMLMGLKTPLKAGDSVKIKLKFASSGEVEVSFPVKAMGGESMHEHSMK